MPPPTTSIMRLVAVGTVTSSLRAKILKE